MQILGDQKDLYRFSSTQLMIFLLVIIQSSYFSQ